MRDQCRNATQRGLLVSEHTEFVTACLRRPAALISLCGAQSGQF
jgi:hypothetical protein